MTGLAPRLHSFAQIAKAAYQEDAAPFHSLGFERARLVSRQGAQCWVLENSTQLVFAFRGTEFDQSSDIKASLKIALRPAMTRRMRVMPPPVPPMLVVVCIAALRAS